MNTNSEPIVAYITKVINGEQMQIGLTKQEAYQIYEQYEHLCDLDYVNSHIADYTDAGDSIAVECTGLTINELTQQADAIAWEMRRQMDKYDVDRDFALDEAFKIIKHEVRPND